MSSQNDVLCVKNNSNRLKVSTELRTFRLDRYAYLVKTFEAWPSRTSDHLSIIVLEFYYNKCCFLL